MKICERAQDFFQIYDVDGSVRICGWIKDGNIGKLTEHSVRELYHNEKAQQIRDRHLCGDHSLCMVDACPYLAMNELDSHSTEYTIQEYPKGLYIGFEQVCNYACRCCTIHDTMIRNNKRDLSSNYDRIEEEIRKALPYVKRVSANGCGELFVSKRTLKLLQEWKPLCPPEEAEVVLETNGSLFDEKHWKLIENVGKYHLSVAVTVMSFDEEIYQFLSGTRLPLSQIENNLRFIKSLREKEIINYLEIATVVQEQNFRGVPEFAKRCVEEFGADYVRLRPYQTWGAESREEAWLTDIRNPEHPYYQEYKRVMSHPYLQHPKVHDWAGGLDTVEPVRFPYKDEYYKEKIIADIVLRFDDIIQDELKLTRENRVYIYGLADIGKVLLKEFLNHDFAVAGIIDQYVKNDNFLNVPIFGLQKLDELEKDAYVIVTPIVSDKSIFQLLQQKGINNYLSVKRFVLDQQLQDELESLSK